MAESKKVTFKFPKSIGGCADELWKIREARYAAQKVVDELAEKEKLLREHIIKVLPKSETTGVSGKLANVLAKTKTVPQVEDWDQVWKYVIKTKSTDLLQKRLDQSAVEARWGEHKKIPGVGEFQVVTLSLTKIKS